MKSSSELITQAKDEYTRQMQRATSGAGAPPPPPVDTPSSGGDDGRMEKRIEALEAANLETRDRLARIETRLETVASKSDVSSLKGELLTAMAQTETRMIKWFIGTAVVLAGVAFTAAKMFH